MGQRVTAEQLREILCLARKLRNSAQEENDDNYVDLYLRAALALEERARQLAFHPYDPSPPDLDEDIRAIIHKPVNIIC